MNEKDFERIAQMVAQVIDKKLEPMNVRFDQIDARLEQFDARFEEMEGRFNARFEEMDAKVESFKSEIISEFNHSLEIQFEALSHKMELLRDGVAYVGDCPLRRCLGRCLNASQVTASLK